MIMIDKECLDCKRYYSGSCNGVKDRKRKIITIENSCSGYLKQNKIHNNLILRGDIMKKSVFKLCRSHMNKKNVRSFTATNINHMKIAKKI